MRKLVVGFDDLKAIEALGKLGVISYIPLFHEEIKIVFIHTEMSDEELLEIEGVVSVREQLTYTINI